MLPFETIIAEITDLGIMLFKEKLSKNFCERECRKKLENYARKQFDSKIFNLDKYSEIDFEGLKNYLIKSDDIYKYVFNTNAVLNERLLGKIFVNAKNFAFANTEMASDVTNKFTRDAIEIIKNFYESQLSPEAQLTISTISNNFRIITSEIVDNQKKYHETIVNELKKLQSSELNKPKDSSEIVIHFLTEKPTTSDRIIGRDKDIKDFIERFKKSNKILIMGIGGIGKSEFAKAVYWTCTELYETYQYFGWMSFDKDIKYTFVKYIKGNFKEKTVELLFEEIMSYLGQLNERILIVIDNVPANSEVINQLENILLRNTKLCIMLTSRITELEGFEPYLVAPLKMKFCYELFFRYSKHIANNANNRKLVREIIETLVWHTLSIEVIAKSAWINKIDLNELHKKILEFKYPKDFKLQIKIIKDDRSYQDYCFELLKYIFNDVTKLNDDQKEVLFFLSALPYQEYNYDLILLWITQEKLSILNDLIQCGWVQERRAQNCSISVHPLISEVSTETLEVEIMKFSKYFKNIRKWNEANENNFEFISQNAAIFTELFLRYEKLLKPHLDVSKDIIYLGDSGAYMLHSLAYYERAYEFCNKVIEAKKVVFGEFSVEVSNSYNDLAIICKEQKKFEEGFANLDNAEMILERFPNELEMKAKVYNSRAGIYRENNNISECIKCLEKALEIRESYLQPGDILIATSYNNLATLYRDNNEIDKSETLFLNAIDILKELPDKKHPYLGTAYYNYALIFLLKDKQDIEKAKKYLIKAYDIRASSLGLDHPHTVLVANKLKELDNLSV